MPDKAIAVPWTREHGLIALNLYCKLPFGKLHRGNGIIKDVAARMGRTASSLALKLVNFASLDPLVQARGKSGMKGASAADRKLWGEFQGNLEVLGPLSEQLLHDLVTRDDELEIDLLQPDRLRVEPPPTSMILPEDTETTTQVKVRRGQHFFRQSILSAYDVRCCITGINVPELLVASHIKPWRDFPRERLEPRNGLCLSSIHDRAFDVGLITLDKDFKVKLSGRLKSYFPQSALEQSFVPFEGATIRMPGKLAEPSQDYVTYHRENIFHS
jgi:putative restriction endonuclease